MITGKMKRGFKCKRPVFCAGDRAVKLLNIYCICNFLLFFLTSCINVLHLFFISNSKGGNNRK
jgi:hypothetical protein